MISPTTTDGTVISANAMITEIACGRPEKRLSIMRETAGSPTAPSASALIWMPSCIAVMKRDGSETIRRTIRARRSPCPTSSSSRVWRTDTNAYSAATKNAFQRIRRTTRTSSRA